MVRCGEEAARLPQSDTEWITDGISALMIFLNVSKEVFVSVAEIERANNRESTIR